jgi:hypothetical protein
MQASTEGGGVGEEARVTYAGNTAFTIRNGSVKIQGDYIFTNPSLNDIEYTIDGLKFKAKGSLILN